MNSNTKIRVVIADDHEIYLLGLNSLLKRQEKYEIVGRATNGSGLIELVDKKNPDLVVFDFLMPGMNGLDAIMKIKAKYSNIKSVIISNTEDNNIKKLCESAGIDAFVSKTKTREEFLGILEQVMAGKKYYTSNENVRIDYNNIKHSENNPFHKLSNRELEFIKYFTQGYTYTQISQKMNISDRTVNTHRVNVTRKLGKLTLGELINLSRVWGVLEY
ncbi:MAG: response regulator transcription factor [Leptospiraceae bacterium]|nr:response regulator transcription factor [Leptospiraceae bacterium]MCP5511089.1 response regulator transcription factor [Leptospiraceae bacterium]